ncbi:MAG TPA: hypothetical protein VG778_11800 [Blastocatellia bacterium]|nr:hypothetical protein [Blastocatellia bacterium]
MVSTNPRLDSQHLSAHNHAVDSAHLVYPYILEDRTPWAKLTEWEKALLVPKLIQSVEQSERGDYEPAAARFDELVSVEGDEGKTLTNLVTVQNFIAAMGGHSGGDAWDEIVSFEAVNALGAGQPPEEVQSSSLEICVRDRRAFLKALSREGFVVNEVVARLVGKFYGTLHPFDNARARTLYDTDPQLHLSNDRVKDPDYGPCYFWAHFDRTSVNAKVKRGPRARVASAREHEKGFASPERVRDYLQRMGMLF